MKKYPQLLPCVLLAFSLSACGGSGVTAPVAAAPVTWQLNAGTSAQQEAFQGTQFYPSSITIDAGDTVQWTFPTGEPHTVAFLGPRSAPPPPTDPSVPAPAGGATYDGSTYTSSGFVLLGKTYALTFPKAGTYVYYCLLHRGMQGTITVNPAGTAYPQTQSTINTQGATLASADLAQAAAAPPQFPYPAGGPHLAAGISFGLQTGTNVLSSVVRFLDGPTLASSVTVPVGTSVTWTNLSSNFPHTVTFGVVGQPFPVLNPFAPPSGGTSYDGTALVNSGPLFPGASYTLTFTRAGTYTYHCIFHDDTENMIGTVVVQ
ncbi:MAG: plastocyanin/azurin family copper-binding protein [Candidatus Eremiobacteraeota bacterium]|nr:plastocyanin/azurin family copper-binding protein [Candidatus Eremiobacteraeota bacterium]